MEFSLVVAVTLLYIGGSTAASKVTGIDPVNIGYGGKVKVTINGEGFAEDQFAYGQGKENLGNKVSLVAGKETHVCEIHKNDCTKNKIVCYTPSGLKHNTGYSLFVTVNGKKVSSYCSWCKFWPRTWKTPEFSSIEPVTGEAGQQLLTMHGRIFTNISGSNVKGDGAHILRMFGAPGTKCNLYKANDEAYQLEMDPSSSTDGTIQCRPEGTYVGGYIPKLLISPPYGLSIFKTHLYKVSRTGNRYVVQAYTVIKGVTPSTGSVDGGTVLTIDGGEFDDNNLTYAKARAYVGDSQCKILKVEPSKYITCEVPEKRDASWYAGNRGVILELFDESFATYEEARDTVKTPSKKVWIDATKYCAPHTNKWTRKRFVFDSPGAGLWDFSIWGDEGAKLFIDDGPGYEAMGSKWKYAGRKTLEADQKVKMVVVGKPGTEDTSCVQIRAFYRNHTALPNETSNSVPEMQRLIINSTEKFEQFTLKFSGFSQKNPTNAKQKVCINGGNGTVRIGILEAYTVNVDLSGDLANVKKALNDLPFKSAEDSFVVEEDGQNCVIVTFESPGGKLPLLTTDPSSGYTVEIVTEGKSNNLDFAFQFGDRPGPLITYDVSNKEAFATKIKSALEEMLGVRCPPLFTTNINAKFHEGYETRPSKFDNSETAEDSAFCGRYSCKNCKSLYLTSREGNAKVKPMSNSNWLCFASRGLDNDDIVLKFSNKNDNTPVLSRRYQFKSDNIKDDGEWKYKCIDVQAEFDATNWAGLETTIGFFLVDASVKNNDGTNDFYIDDVLIGHSSSPLKILKDTNTPIAKLRMPIAYPNTNKKTTTKWVSVTYNTTEDHYAVSIAPFDCGYNFKLLTLSNSQVTISGSAANSTLKDMTGTMVTTRTGQAQKPVTGKFRITYNGTTSTEIEAFELTEEQLKSNLEVSIDDLGTLGIKKTEDSTCANMNFEITFTDKPGDRPMMTVIVEFKTPGDAFIEKGRDGYYNHAVLGDGDILTYHTDPQVRVYINDIATKCTLPDSECKYLWSADATPSAKSMDKSMGYADDTLTITGTKFSTEKTENLVTIGDVECVVTSSTAEEIVCTVGNNELGEHSVTVVVQGKGKASGDLKFTQKALVSEITPVTSSIGGNINVTLKGKGFSKDMVVKVDTTECVRMWFKDSTRIDCQVPAYTDLTVSSSQTVDVTIFVGDDQIPGTQTFTYAPLDAGVTVTEVSTDGDLTVYGKQTITIKGSNMGELGKVMLGPTELEEVSRSNTEITAKPPRGIPAGLGQSLLVFYANSGPILQSSSIPKLDIKLKVTAFNPTKGSLIGGTKLTFTGIGFGDVTNDVKVNLVEEDDEVECKISDVKNQKIECVVGDMTSTHVINNKDCNEYPLCFNKKQLEIRQGDTILFSFTTPEAIANKKFTIFESDSLESKVPKSGGFNETIEGQHVHTFINLGKRYIVAQSLNSSGTHFCMIVYVKSMELSTKAISVTVVGQDALYTPSPSITKRSADPVDDTGCSLAIPNIANCNDGNDYNGDGKMKIHLTCSRTPKVKSISMQQALADIDRSIYRTTKLKFQGEGFSRHDCANIVKVGDCICTVTGSNENENSFDCSLGSSCSYDTMKYYPISVNIKPLGDAIIESEEMKDKHIVVIPSFSSISPQSGSLGGGTLMTINGYAFTTDVNNVHVSFGGHSSTCTSADHHKLICTSPSKPIAGIVDVTVKIGETDAKCESNDGCKYSYDSANTPTVTGVTPSEVSSQSTLKFTGTNLGNDANKVTIKVADKDCSGINIVTNSEEVSCTVDGLPAGESNVTVHIKGNGFATTTVKVKATSSAELYPKSGSIYGYTTVSFTGFGFVSGLTITVDGKNFCEKLTYVDSKKVTCVTKAGGLAKSVSVVITSNSVAYNALTFEYSASNSPNLQKIEPNKGTMDTQVVLTGTGFGNDELLVQVHIGELECTDVKFVDNTITCNVGQQPSGEYDATVTVEDSGRSNNVPFKYTIDVTSSSPLEADVNGGHRFKLSGNGFIASMEATICDNPCNELRVPSITESTCLIPPGTEGTACDVKVKDANGETITLPNKLSYKKDLIPMVTRIEPQSGGTKGGTLLTIQGVRFSTIKSDISVTIDGVTCEIQSAEAQKITCITGEHEETKLCSVEVSINGISATAANAKNLQFPYGDKWSSNYTWGGNPVPIQGDYVVIPEGKTIIIDTDTAVLEMLLIQGGHALFAEKDVTLRAKRILIVNNGSLRIGSEDNPFQYIGIIELHGDFHDHELPLYGTKVIAVRNGTLSLHGRRIENTWTLLSQTASKDSKQITVQGPINGWQVGDEIVIATTGGHTSQKETETGIIEAISGNTITLKEALKYKHLGNTENYSFGDGSPAKVDFRAEVGLLTRNVKVIGKRLEEFDTNVEACPKDFDTGEFATQTCFQGRFGNETESDQFGATVMMHGQYPAKSTDIKEQTVFALLSNVEFTHSGQAFRLGRYPIHFHLMGPVNGSYVRCCSIHRTFNRAVNIHNTHNVLVEHNVVYDVMGGALFLEDGIETGNILQYNLVAFVKSSTSLLNDDITPASFWITNPNNTVQHNHAFGGTHFGFWFRMHEHPDGPSFTKDICPRRVTIGKFFNNTAHSFSWFGVWIFEEFYPAVDSLCKAEKGPIAAIIERCTFWNNKKGIELVTVGAVHTERLVSAQNYEAGMEYKLIKNAAPVGALLDKSLFIGQANEIDNQNEDGITDRGVVFPFADDLTIRDTKFVNFESDSSVCLYGTSIDGTCSDKCGAYKMKTQKLKFKNSPNRVRFRWFHEVVIIDEDGSLCNTTNKPQIILPRIGTLPDGKCKSDCSNFTKGSIIPPSNCEPDVKFTRFGFNELVPASVWGKIVYFNTTENGKTLSVESYFRDHRVEHKNGWIASLQVNKTHNLEFKDTEAMVNMSFIGRIDDMDPGDCLILKVKLMETPDKLSVDDGKTNKPYNKSFDCSNLNIVTGNWYFEKKETFGYAAIAFVNRGNINTNIPVNLKAVKCFFENCTTPLPEYQKPPPTERPSTFQLWSDQIWTEVSENNIKSTLAPNDQKVDPPKENQNVNISKDMWVVISKYDMPSLGIVYIFGGLEIAYEYAYNYIFEAKIIIIQGGRFHIGWLNNPIKLGTVNIVLSGDRNSPPYNDIDGAPLSNKAMGVYGGLEMIGKEVVKSWLRLRETVLIGAKILKIQDGSVILQGWKPKDKIFITSSSTNKKDLEMAIIKSINVNDQEIELENPVSKRHSGGFETVNGVKIYLGAAVGLLSRTIIVGEETNNDAWGGRILVSSTSYEGNLVLGYARLRNVLFRNIGQEGFREDYDPRYGVSYVNTLFNASNKPSEVYNCAFENIFNAAVGVFGTKDIRIEGNVILKALGSAVVTTSESTTLNENLIANTYCSPAYDGRNEKFNLALEYAVEAISSKLLEMHDNYVCGSERIGYHVPGIACDASVMPFTNNSAVGNLIGVAILPDDTLTHGTCVKLSGFTVYKNYDAGIYYHNTLSFIASNNIYSDETTALFTMPIGPDPLEHTIGDEYAEVVDSTVIGTSSVTSCVDDIEPSGDYIDLSSDHRSSKGPNSERLGLLMAVFTGAKNNCPIKPCFKIMSYNAISGQMTIKDVTFVNFNGAEKSCKPAYAIATLKKNDDANHPVLVSNIKKINVDKNYIVLIHRPNKDKINSADCVDMDCDALKKVLVKALDASLFGHVGSVISESEFEWDGDRARGLGDYRIPKTALSDLNGKKLDAPVGKGIVRTDNCKLITVSNGAAAHYWCTNEKYEMMLIESFDDDTEKRRLGPTAFFSRGDKDYVDLMNGPQDHGWCNGYTCLKRISTFIGMIRDQTPVKMYFSSTQPDHIRFALIRAESSRCTVVGLYYLNPNRIDVYNNTLNGNDFSKSKYNLPKNGEYDENGDFRLKIESGVDYKPTCSDYHGANYIDREAHMIYFVLKGGDNTIHLKRADVIVVAMGFPAIKIEDFFRDDLIVNNIAALLGIPKNKIRVLNVVSESSGGRRRRRETDSGVSVTFEIGDGPPSNNDDENTEDVGENTENVEEYAKALMNACQTSEISGDLDVQTECDEIVYGDITYTPTPPAELRFSEEIVTQHEGVPFSVQPKIRAYDKDGNLVEYLGIEESPWEITASLRSCNPPCGHANAILTGTLTITSSHGFFNFTDLTISHKGDGYIIDFEISSPTNTNLTLESSPFSVAALPMSAEVYSMTSGDIPQNSVFSLTLDLRDKSTQIAIPDATWRGHTAFDAKCDLAIESKTGTLSGTTSKSFDLVTGRATFDDLVFSGYGLIHISCQVESTPPEYDFVSSHKVFVLGDHKASIVLEASENIQVRFSLDYDLTLPTETAEAQFLQGTIEAFAMKYGGVVIRTASVSKGSIIVSFTIEGQSVNITSTKEEICSDLSSGFEVTFGGSTVTLDRYMKVDGVDYYSSCGKEDDDDDDGLHPAYIALIVVLCLLVIGIIVFILVWRFVIRPKSKTHGIRSFTVTEYPGMNDNTTDPMSRGGFYYIDNGRTVYLGAANQKTQDIMYKQKGANDFRPNSSAPITTLYDEAPGRFTVRTSPLPPKLDEDVARGLTPTGP